MLMSGFVHVELVRTDNFDEFARSINNYADYIANILYDYNLGVSSAEETGKGSLWSHKAVSNHLGGTTHVDPHGYFARYGYNWHQFVSLVRQKHNALVNSKKANTSKLAHIKSAQVKIYRTPTNINKYSKAGSKNLNKVFYVKAEARVGGTNYYLLSNNPSSKTGTIGWVESKSVNFHTHKGVDKKRKTFYVKGTGKAYSKAWGGPKDLVYESFHEEDEKI
jgi:internalin B